MDLSEVQRNEKSQVNRHPWEISRLMIIKGFLKKHTNNIRHILDVGCGDGYVLTQLRKLNIAIKYTGIDTAFKKEELELLNQAYDDDIQFYNALPSSLSPEIDCILMLDVLEHCESDFAVLNTIYNHASVNNSVKIFITVPAFQSIYSKHDNLLGHYRRYNYKQLKTLIRKSHMEIIESGYFFSSLLMVRAFHLLLEKYAARNVDKSIDNWNGSKWITRTATALLYFDFQIAQLLLRLGIRIPGLSLYCICQR